MIRVICDFWKVITYCRSYFAGNTAGLAPSPPQGRDPIAPLKTSNRHTERSSLPFPFSNPLRCLRESHNNPTVAGGVTPTVTVSNDLLHGGWCWWSRVAAVWQPLLVALANGLLWNNQIKSVNYFGANILFRIMVYMFLVVFFIGLVFYLCTTWNP